MKPAALEETPPRSDEELIALLAVGGEAGAQAFTVLYDRHASFVYWVALRLLRSPEEAEDVLQDLFEKLWENQVTFEPGRARFTTWLFTVTRNRCLDRLKGAARRPRHLPLPERTLFIPEEDTESDAYEAECSRRVRAAVAALPETQRDALLACAFQGLTHKQAAESLGVPLGTLKSRVKAAMSQIAASLQGLEEEE